MKKFLKSKNDKFKESVIRNLEANDDYQNRLKKIACSMFEWVNLPDSMSSRYLEETLFYDGKATLLYDETNIPRNDLLAALIQDDFNYTNYFGGKIYLKSDLPSVADVDYACRTLTFEQITDNNTIRKQHIITTYCMGVMICCFFQEDAF